MTVFQRRFFRFWLTLAVLHFSLTYVGRHGSNISLSGYVSGTAFTPYQYRILCAWVMRGLLHIPGWYGVAAHVAFLNGDPYRLAMFPIVAASMVAAMWFTEQSLLVLGIAEGDRLAGAALLLFFSYFSLVTNYVAAFLLPYDVPSLMFFAGGIYAILSRRLWLFYVLFTLGTFNRETTIFLTPFFAIYLWDRKSTPPHVAVQLTIWSAVKVWAHHIYGTNPTDNTVGGLAAFKLFWNLKEILKPWQWPSLASVFGFLLPVYLLGFRYMRNRRFAWGSLVLLGLWFAAMMVTAVIIEIRVFTELNAVMAIALVDAAVGCRSRAQCLTPSNLS